MKITVAVTGASGTIYAKRLIEKLIQSKEVEQVFVVFSQSGLQVASYELPHWKITEQDKVRILSNDDFFAPIASGSSVGEAMVIVPCSMGALGRIASGISSDLISRAADVTLKERARLIVVPRESPFSLIHLNNMTTLTQAGAIIMAASPSFYSHPSSIDELVDTIVERILSQLKIKNEDRYHWGE